jgi:hypothetical protein
MQKGTNHLRGEGRRLSVVKRHMLERASGEAQINKLGSEPEAVMSDIAGHFQKLAATGR